MASQETVSLTSARSALILVDMHTAPNVECAAAYETACTAMTSLLQLARERDFTVVHAHEADASCAPMPDLAPMLGDNEHLVRLGGVSAFTGSALGVLLGAACTDTVILAGDDTDLALSALAREARARGMRVFLAEEAILSPHPLKDVSFISQDGLLDAMTQTGQGAAERDALRDTRLLRTLGQRIAPAHTALILIDVQNDFCDPAGANGRRDPAMGTVFAAAERIPDLLAGAREQGCLVVHVGAEYGKHVRNSGSPYRFPSTVTRERAVWSASAAYIDDNHRFPAGDVEVCLPQTWGGQFIDSIVPRDDEIVITKHRFSAFIGTALETRLRARGIRTLVVAGVTTNCCVESTVRDASMLDFNVVVVSDCVAVKDTVKSLHDASLEQIRTYFGLVEPLERIQSAWRGD